MPATRRTRHLVLLLTALLALGGAALASAAPPADSAILFIGDGMGPVLVHLAGQAAGRPLAMQQMPFSGVVTTNSANACTTDSAAAATALASGHKTNNGMVGVDPANKPLLTILERARAMYHSAGVLTTDALHGATPAGFAAHAKNRGESSNIAAQMAASGAQVMMGFWKDEFLPKSAGGKRDDGRNLVSELQAKGYQVVFTKDELLNAKGDKLVGLFDDATGPSLSEMVSAALPRLSPDPDGFFLIVEGARIDWECHDGNLIPAIAQVQQLDQAVAVGLDFARQRGRTLVLVTADHETGGLQPDGAYTVGHHTSTPVRVFAFGPGGDRFAGEMDNTDIPKRIAEILEITPFPQ